MPDRYRQLLTELRDDPRPLSASEAAGLLHLSAEQMTALNLPVVGHSADGEDVYDSAQVLHWYELRRSDPKRFEDRIAQYHGEPPQP